MSSKVPLRYLVIRCCVKLQQVAIREIVVSLFMALLKRAGDEVQRLIRNRFCQTQSFCLVLLVP